MNNSLPKGWEWKELGEICNIYNGSTPSKNKPVYWNGNILWATPTDVSHLKTKYIEDTKDKITREGYESCSTHLLPIGTVIFTSRASIGHIAITKKELCTNQGFKNFVCKHGIIPEFLYYSLKIKKKEIEKLASGSTFKEISMSSIKKVKIPLPPISTQKQIVSILERAEKLKEMREKANENTNKILQSIFLEMFGDPNQSIYPLKPLNEVCDYLSDGSHFTPKFVDKGIPFITVKNLNDGKIDFENCSFISKEDFNGLKKKCNPKVDDVLFSKDGTVGKVALIDFDKDFIVLSSLAILRANKKIINPKYLSVLLKNQSILKQAFDLKTGSAIRRIVVRDIKKIKIPVPPIELQNNFASVVEKFELVKENQKQSTKEINQLFDALMQKSFKGELINN